MGHRLWKTGEFGAPDFVKDRNGDVVLGLCRWCGKAEVELSEPCEPDPVLVMESKLNDVMTRDSVPPLPRAAA